MKSLLIFSCLLALSLATMDLEWESFKTKFNKKYLNPTEEVFRKKIFLDNKMTIDQHNRLFAEGKSTFTMSINQFADLTTREFREQMTGVVKTPYDPSATVHENVGATPAAFDWRTKNCVTRVKDQGKCGSCWAFAATASVESVQCVKAGKLIELSEQELVDCSRANWNRGCAGGWVINSYQYIIGNGGISKESAYPYTATDGQCNRPVGQNGASIRSYNSVASGSEEALRNAVYQQPVAVSVGGCSIAFAYYSGGIFYEQNCQPVVCHAMLVVGFGTESGNDYWIVKNSWGTGWGEKGYIRMARNKGNNCGIASDASYPIY